MQLITGCSSATITHFAGLFRQLAANEVEEDEGQIGGENVIVEIDESKFGKPTLREIRAVKSVKSREIHGANFP